MTPRNKFTRKLPVGGLEHARAADLTVRRSTAWLALAAAVALGILIGSVGAIVSCTRQNDRAEREALRE